MGSGGKGGGGGGDQKVTVRYAGYIEDHHKALLNIMTSYRDAALTDSPFAGYTDIEVDLGFFGVGYSIGSFPSLYDMFGKFVAGLDIDVLFNQAFAQTVNSTEVDNLVTAEGALLDDDIDTNVLPRFQTGQRDINSVLSSTFVIGKAQIEDARVKAIEKFSSELRYRLIPVATERWAKHLEWNKTVIAVYNQVMNLYFATKQSVTDFNYEMLSKDKLWPFTIMEYDRACVGALQGATTTTSKQSGGGGWQSYVSSALSVIGIGAILFGDAGNPTYYHQIGNMVFTETIDKTGKPTYKLIKNPVIGFASTFS